MQGDLGRDFGRAPAHQGFMLGGVAAMHDFFGIILVA